MICDYLSIMINIDWLRLVQPWAGWVSALYIAIIIIIIIIFIFIIVIIK